MIWGSGAARDLIEAGLREPADATSCAMGSSVATLVPYNRLSAMRWRRLGDGDAGRLALVDATDAAIASPGWTLRWRLGLAGGSGRWLSEGVIAPVAADAATPAGSMLGSRRVLMTYRARVATARHGGAAGLSNLLSGNSAWSGSRILAFPLDAVLGVGGPFFVDLNEHGADEALERGVVGD